MSKSLLIWSLLFLLPISSVGSAGTSDEGWSKPVDGLQARLSFVKTDGFNGTPYIIPYLELRNVSEIANVLEVPLKIESIAFEMKNEAGTVVPTTGGEYDGMSMPLGMVRLPYDSYLRFNITKRGAGVSKDQAGLLDIGPQNVWEFRAGDKHNYFLSAKFTIKPPEERIWAGTIVIPPAKLPVLGK